MKPMSMVGFATMLALLANNHFGTAIQISLPLGVCTDGL